MLGTLVSILSSLVLFRLAQTGVLAARDFVMAGEAIDPLWECGEGLGWLLSHGYDTELEVWQL